MTDIVAVGNKYDDDADDELMMYQYSVGPTRAQVYQSFGGVGWATGKGIRYIK